MSTPPGRSRARRVLHLAVPGAALGILAWTARASVQELLVDPARIGWAWVGLALVLNLAYRVANAASLTLVLRALGQSLGVRPCTRVWLRSELLRWLPGGVWGYLSRARQLSAARVPGPAAAAAIPLELFLTLAAWGAVALVGSLLSGVAGQWAEHLSGAGYWLLAGAAGLAAAPFVVRWAWPHLQARLEPLRGLRLHRRWTLAALASYTGLNVLRGVGFACVLLAILPQQPPLGVTISANAIGWIVGFLAVLAPGGMGVREAMIVLLLSPWIGVGDASLAALLWRATQIVEELLLVPVAMQGVKAPRPASTHATQGHALTSWAVGLGVMTLVLWFSAAILVPGWKRPSSRSFQGMFGYGNVVRASGGGFELEAARVEQRRFEVRFLGEGRTLSDTVLVPIVPMSIVDQVAVEVGQSVAEDDLLVAMDESQERIRLAAAEAAVGRAEAELERRRVGAHQTQVLERTELHRTNLEFRQREDELASEMLERYQQLEEEGLISRKMLIEYLMEATEAEREARAAEIMLQGSEVSRSFSLDAAQMALDEANSALDERRIQLGRHRVLAPTGGVVREVLVREGEYNQNRGSAGVVLSVGSWFEARLGQAALAGVIPRTPCTVHLAAHPGVAIDGVVTRIVPFVENDVGGPETSRPIRPRGTGAPEWPSTFRVMIEVDPETELAIVPGLTGYASIRIERTGLGVPESAVDSLSRSEGIVFVVGEESTPLRREREDGVVRAGESERWVDWSPRRVRIGHRTEGWVEILEGLEEDEEVLLGGHGLLRESDSVRIIEPGVRR